MEWENSGNRRIPRNITAILSGAGLALSGLLLQTLFRNPLAGPSVLGITSGSSLGVALVLLSGGGLGISMGSGGVLVGAILGALAVLFLISLISLKYEDVTLVLVAGLMLGFLTSSLVSVMAFFAEAEQLKQIEEMQNRDILEIPECQDCAVAPACGGGCAVLAYNKSKTFLSPDCRPVKELVALGIEFYDIDN